MLQKEPYVNFKTKFCLVFPKEVLPQKIRIFCVFELEINDFRKLQGCDNLCELIENTAFISGGRPHILIEKPERQPSFLELSPFNLDIIVKKTVNNF